MSQGCLPISFWKIAFTEQNPPSFSKIYDGDSDATSDLVKALSNASITSATGFLNKDSEHVTLNVTPYDNSTGKGAKATYGDGNDTSASPWTPNANAGTHNVKIEGIVSGSATASQNTISF